MRLARMILTISFILTLIGCPYDSKFPLSKSCDSKIDSSLIGKWISVSPDSLTKKDTFLINVIKFNDSEYLIELSGTTDNKIEKHRGFITELNGDKIFNLIEIGDVGFCRGCYSFYKYQIKKDSLIINYFYANSINDNNIKTIEDFRNYFWRHLNKEIKLDKENFIFTKRK